MASAYRFASDRSLATAIESFGKIGTQFRRPFEVRGGFGLLLFGGENLRHLILGYGVGRVQRQLRFELFAGLFQIRGIVRLQQQRASQAVVQIDGLGIFLDGLAVFGDGLGVFALRLENLRRELIDAIGRRRLLVHAVDGVVPRLHVVARRDVEHIGIAGEILFELRDNRSRFGEAFGGDMALRQSDARQPALASAGECLCQIGGRRVALAGSGPASEPGTAGLADRWGPV